MQKIINGIAIFSGAVALGVVGLGGYVFIRKDAIIDNVKSKIMESVKPIGDKDAIYKEFEEWIEMDDPDHNIFSLEFIGEGSEYDI